MKRYGLLGKTLKHSFSKTYFSKKFEEEGIPDCSYENYELENIEQLAELLKQNPDLKGLNVTIPYKEEVIPYLNFKNDIVSKIKACNCIKISEGQLHGFNTDVIGFKQSLENFLQPQHTKALVLGTGGSAKAVYYALESLNIEYKIVSRTKTSNTLTYEEVNAQLLEECKLIINTSPVGMYPHMDDAPKIPYQHLHSQHLLFDLIYNPAKTKFLQLGEDRGASICNGSEMLVLQAEESWRIWNS